MIDSLISYRDRFAKKYLGTEEQQRVGVVAFLAALMVIVCAFSYFLFMGQSLRLDESQSLWQTSRSALGVFYIVAQDVHPPLYHQILHLWIMYVSDTVQGARFLSLIYFLLSIPALYFLGKKTYSRSVGLWAAGLFAISPFMNWYGNEIRMYSLLTLFTILNQYFFVELWKNSTARVKKADTWFWYFITALCGIYTQYFFLLVLATQALFYFMRQQLFPKGTFAKFCTVAGILAVLYIPWIAYVIHQNQIGSQTPALLLPTSVDLFSVFQQFIFGFQNNAVSTVFLSLWPLGLVFGFLALQRHSRIVNETEYFMLAVFVPILVAFGVSYEITPVFVSRYLIIAVPALYLCLLSLFNSFRPRVSFICKVALVIVMLIGLGIEIESTTTPVKEDYRDVSNYLNTHVQPQDVVILSAPFTVYPFEYYYHGAAPFSTLPIWDQYGHGAIPPFSEATLPAQVASSTAGAQDVWLVLSYNQGYEKNIQQYFDLHYKRLYVKTFSPDLTLYVYQIRYDAALSSEKRSF